jgi:CheY-like chemotaxis protein
MVRRVLVVDDEAATREICRLILKHYGFEVTEAVDGKEAVQRARGEHPDAIVMDIGLPVLDGWEASRRLKADPKTAAIPIVALTAFALPSARERSAEVGCAAHLEKPVDPRRIAETVKRLVED